MEFVTTVVLGNIEYVTTVPNYNWRNSTVDQWDSYFKIMNELAFGKVKQQFHYEVRHFQ